MTLTANPKGVKAARVARLALGTPYVWGGENLRLGVDCSGLCVASYATAGAPLRGRTTYDLWGNYPEKVDVKNIVAGDLLFLEPSSAGPNHVVMAADPTRCIAAQHTGTVVKYFAMDYFTKDSAFMGARRPYPASGSGAPGTTSGGGDTSGGGGSNSGIVSSITDGVSSVRDGVSALTNPHTWFRVGQVVLGLILLVGGILVFNRGNIEAAGSVAAKVAPLVAL